MTLQQSQMKNGGTNPMSEKWKKIELEGHLYEVSNFGRVRSRTENAVEDLRDIKYDLMHVDMDEIDEAFIGGIAETLGEIIDDLADGR